jgi:acetyl-CoA carboxylase biotin carboxyl carrier protein
MAATRRGGALPDLRAEVTGTVFRIECSVGDTVAEGGTVLIMESMKLEIPLESTHGGTVTEIRCAEGQAVEEGEILVVLE